MEFSAAHILRCPALVSDVAGCHRLARHERAATLLPEVRAFEINCARFSKPALVLGVGWVFMPLLAFRNT